MQFTETRVQANTLIKREAKVSEHINIAGHYDHDTLIDKNGRLIKLFQLEGIDQVTQHQLTLDIYKRRLNSLFKTFNSHYALYTWVIRSKTTEFPAGEFSQPFAHDLNSKYRTRIEQNELFHNKLYLALITKVPERKVDRMTSWIKNLSHAVNKEEKAFYLKNSHQELTQVTQKLLSTFKDYHIRQLGCIQRRERPAFSEALSLISQLVNVEETSVPLLPMDASTYLPSKHLFFNARSGTIEIRSYDHRRKFGAIVSLKEYTPYTYTGMLDRIQQLPFEFILTQSYRFFDPYIAKAKVKHQQQDLEQARDESVSQTDQLTDSLDEVASGEAGQGLHHLTLLCIAETQEQLNRYVAHVIADFSKLDIICVRETPACEMGFWAQLPENFKYIGREASISTKNFAGLSSFHNPAIGHAHGNFWGNAVTLLETQSGSPYYFNFHYNDIGNTLCFGSMGSGKTTVIGFLLAQSLKFGGKRVVFDKDRGLEILIRALGGHSEILKPGIFTGFNPCQLPDTAENRIFLQELFKKMLTVHGQSWDENDTEIVTKSIERLYTLSQEDRQLIHIAPYFGAKKRGSLRSRLEEWYGEGNKAWLFDNPTDQLNLQSSILSFDLTAILDHVECKTPALMYLMHRVTQALEGHRGGIFIDEGWRVLEDDYFKKVINDLSRTPRKKNNFLCLATQSAEDAANKAISKTLEESAACKIFFPNPSASRSTYMDCFGLSEREYELIKTMDDSERYFLLNRGRGKESIVVRVNLTGLEDEIAIISGREETVKLLDQLRAELGDPPDQWIPEFHRRRKKLCG